MNVSFYFINGFGFFTDFSLNIHWVNLLFQNHFRSSRYEAFALLIDNPFVCNFNDDFILSLS